MYLWMLTYTYTHKQLDAHTHTDAHRSVDLRRLWKQLASLVQLQQKHFGQERT